jgi:MFS transporter, SHS family, lactate transporter
MISLQDLYPTMLENQYNFDANQVTVTQVVANLGAMFGGTVVGYCSQIFGRRFSICVMCIVGGALLYPYTFTSGTVGKLKSVLVCHVMRWYPSTHS